MDGARFSLIDTSPDGAAAAAAAPWANRIQVLRAVGDLPHGSTAPLVRPDGYAAWNGAGPGAEEVRSVLGQWAGVQPARV